MVTSSLVRAQLVKALEAELVGPYSELEELDRAPSRTYLTGYVRIFDLLLDRDRIIGPRAVTFAEHCRLVS